LFRPVDNVGINKKHDKSHKLEVMYNECYQKLSGTSKIFIGVELGS